MSELADRLADVDADAARRTDAAFHREIAVCTDNSLLEELLSVCLKRTEPLTARTLRNRDGQELAAKGHRAIADAIASGDAPAARKAMEAHMNDALHSL